MGRGIDPVLCEPPVYAYTYGIMYVYCIYVFMYIYIYMCIYKRKVSLTFISLPIVRGVGVFSFIIFRFSSPSSRLSSSAVRRDCPSSSNTTAFLRRQLLLIIISATTMKRNTCLWVVLTTYLVQQCKWTILLLLLYTYALLYYRLTVNRGDMRINYIVLILYLSCSMVEITLWVYRTVSHKYYILIKCTQLLFGYKLVIRVIISRVVVYKEIIYNVHS